MNEWLVFLCYRQIDGKPTAEWLYQHLRNRPISTQDEKAPRLHIYYDQAAPAGPSEKQVRQRALERARTMLVVCTPGLPHRRGPEDSVHQEIDWWVENRQAAPILIDTTGGGIGWVPERIQARWPEAQRIEFKLQEWERLNDDGRSEVAARVVTRIIEGISHSGTEPIHEEVKRLRRKVRLYQMAFMIALVAVVVLASRLECGG
ncbi:MAG: hypothetical protein JSU86_19535 [Phycisphaerales bacterium]|nr:MAG: hypothetical protein JSU86_19535 [Phycisphaerales bacterium]